MTTGTVRVRVVGLMVINDHVLVQRKRGDEYWALPGGGLEFGETFAQGLEREFLEEFDTRIRVGPRLDVLENFFTIGGQQHHSVEIYFEVCTVEPGTVEAQEPDLESTWLPVTSVNEIRPKGILGRLGVVGNA